MRKPQAVPAVMLIIGAAFIALAMIGPIDHWWKEVVLIVIGVILLIGGIVEGTD